MRGKLRNRQRARDCLLSLLFVIACCLATPARTESILDALGAAYTFNPRLEAARANQRAVDEEVPRALSGFRPIITGSADSSFRARTPDPRPTPFKPESNPHGYEVGLVQPLFRGFRVLSSVSEAEAIVRAGRETLRGTEQSVLLDAVTSFGDVVRDAAILRLRENHVAVLTRDLTDTWARFGHAEVTQTDVAQAETRRSVAIIALDQARANLRTSRATFERVIGHPPSRLIDANPTRAVPKALQEGIDISARENPTVVGALYREQAARHVIDRIRGERLPQVQLEANYAKRYDELPDINWTETAIVTGRLTLPFYSGGEVEARIRQAKHTHVQRLQEIEQARTEVQALVVAAWSQLEAAQAAAETGVRAVETARVALAGVREEERIGQRTLLDVLNAEQELINAQINLASDRRNLVVASYSLLSTIGRLNAQELGVSSQVYDADAHYHDVRRKWFEVDITHSDGRRETLNTARRPSATNTITGIGN